MPPDFPIWRSRQKRRWLKRPRKAIGNKEWHGFRPCHFVLSSRFCVILNKAHVAYTVSKLKDYSDASLQKAARECVQACQTEVGAVTDEAALKAFRDRWLGRKSGILTQINDLWLKAAPKEAKRAAGAGVNQLKAEIEAAGRRCPAADLTVDRRYRLGRHFAARRPPHHRR